MKVNVTIIHCYSDDNRGDTGIVYSIYDLIKDHSPKASVAAMSVFGSYDKRFEHLHDYTRIIFPAIYPSFFPEPSAFLGVVSSNKLFKLLVFCYYFAVNTLTLIFGSTLLAKILLPRREYLSLKNFTASDIIISKGGSFIYSFKGLEGIFFFLRTIYPFFLAKRFGIKAYIYAQSIGPFQNVIARRIFHVLENHIDGIYLREENCVKEIRNRNHKVKIITDSAFYLKPGDPLPKTNRQSIAITARPHNFKYTHQKLVYLDCLKNFIDYALKNNFEIHLIPQVTGPSDHEDDRVILKKLYSDYSETDAVVFHSDRMTPHELMSLYGSMHYLVGTRLHSVIFALGMGVPCISISYHGTKAQGIMESMDLGQYVLSIEDIDYKSLVSKFESLVSEKTVIEKKITSQLPNLRALLKKSIGEILEVF